MEGKVIKGWECSSVVEHLPSIHEALGSISSIAEIITTATNNVPQQNDNKKRG